MILLYLLIGAITESKKLIEYALEAEHDGGEFNMCRALDELIDEGRQEGMRTGKLEGAITTCKKFNISKDSTIQSIMEDFSISQDKALEYVEAYW